MDKRNCLKFCSAVVLAFLLAGNAHAGTAQDLIDAASDSLSTAKDKAGTGTQAVDAIEATQQAADSTAAAAEKLSLTETLMQQLGVTKEQASGGAGAIFEAAKSKMTAEDFQSLTQAVPEMDSMLSSVPQQSDDSVGKLAGSLSSMLGDTDNTLGTVTSLASAFKDLNLSGDMVNQFVPVVVDYVKQNGSAQVASLLQSALGL